MVISSGKKRVQSGWLIVANERNHDHARRSSTRNKNASEDLLPLFYDELRHLAALRMAQERLGHTLQPTALVQEAWLQLTRGGERSWRNRAHFFGAAADAIRRILIDKARIGHGGRQARLGIQDVDLAATTPDDNVVLMDEALRELQNEDPEQAWIVVLKFLGGPTNQEVAHKLRLNESKADPQWACAKARPYRLIREARKV